MQMPHRKRSSTEAWVDHPRKTPEHARYLALIDRLTTVQPPVFVFGGFAEDALIAGRTTRPHGDVDVLVGRADLVGTPAPVRRLGFPGLRDLLRSRARQPARLPLGVGRGRTRARRLRRARARAAVVRPARGRPPDPSHAFERLLQPSPEPDRRRSDPDDLATRALSDACRLHAHAAPSDPLGRRTKRLRLSCGPASWRTSRWRRSSPNSIRTPRTDVATEASTWTRRTWPTCTASIPSRGRGR